MTETKFTPGPWRVEAGTTLIWGDCNPDDPTNYGLGYPIAECRLTPCASWAKGPRKAEEAEANANLIAAATELYEVVEAMARFDGRNNNHHLKNMAKAAIAKARGEA